MLMLVASSASLSGSSGGFCRPAPLALVAFIARMVPFSTGGFHSPGSSVSAKTLSPLLSDHVQGFHTSKLLTLKEELDCPKLLGLAAFLAGWYPSYQSMGCQSGSGASTAVILVARG